MQDEINEQSMTLATRITEMTAAELKQAVDKLLAEVQAQTTETMSAVKGSGMKHGKLTMKELAEHNAGLSSIELKDPNLRLLYKTMKQNGVDFAPVKDGKGKYTLFFKGRDADALTHAFSQYTKKVTERAARPQKPSIASALAAMKQVAKTLAESRDKVKNMDKGERGL
jgi:hypothetical protein